MRSRPSGVVLLALAAAAACAGANGETCNTFSYTLESSQTTGVTTVASAAEGDSCDTEGEMKMQLGSDEVFLCSGNPLTLVPMKSGKFDSRTSDPAGGCGAGNIGQSYFNKDLQQLLVCDGSTFAPVGKPTAPTLVPPVAGPPAACDGSTSGSVYWDTSNGLGGQLAVCDGTEFRYVDNVIGYKQKSAIGFSNKDDPLVQALRDVVVPSNMQVTMRLLAPKQVEYIIRGGTNLDKNIEVTFDHTGASSNSFYMEWNLVDGHMGGGYVTTASTAQVMVQTYCNSFNAYSGRPRQDSYDNGYNMAAAKWQVKCVDNSDNEYEIPVTGVSGGAPYDRWYHKKFVFRRPATGVYNYGGELMMKIEYMAGTPMTLAAITYT